MGTFETLFDKAKNVADAATKMTGEVVDISKVKLQAFKINTNIQKNYENLGSIVYDSIKFGNDSKELVDACVAEIDRLLAELEVLNDSLHSARKAEGIRCMSCGFENNDGSFFCARCGAALDLSDNEPQYTAPTEMTENDESPQE